MREAAITIIAKQGHKYFNLRDLFALRQVSRSFQNIVDKTGLTPTQVVDQLLFDARFWKGFSEDSANVLLQLFSGCNQETEDFHEALVYAILSPDKQAAQPLLLKFQRKLLNLLFQLVISAPEKIVRLAFLCRQMHLGVPTRKGELNELDESEKMLFNCLVFYRTEEEVLPHIQILLKSDKGYENNLLAELEESIKKAPSEKKLICTKKRIYRSLFSLHLVGKEDAVLNLQEMNLAATTIKKALLRFINFTGATFAGSYIHNTEFSWLTLKESDFTGAYLERVSFLHVNLTRANLSGLDLRDVSFDEADFEGANLSGVNLNGLNLAGCNFLRADLCNANMIGVNFEGANFQDANLCGTNLFTKDTVSDFINRIEKSMSSGPTGILPLFLAITEEHLKQINSSSQIGTLKMLSRECLVKALATIDSLEALSKLLSMASKEDNIFRYSPDSGGDVKDIYPDILILIANVYLCSELKSEDEFQENSFREKLVQEINRQKSFFGFQNSGWDSLVSQINRAKLKYHFPSKHSSEETNRRQATKSSF